MGGSNWILNEQLDSLDPNPMVEVDDLSYKKATILRKIFIYFAKKEIKITKALELSLILLTVIELFPATFKNFDDFCFVF